MPRSLRSAALLGLVALAACKKPAPPPAAAPPPPEVTVVTVQRRSIDMPYDFPARIEGSREVEVRPRVTGILLERKFSEGRPVTKGQTLFTIDPKPYAAEVATAEGSLAEERARLADAERQFARLQPLAEAHAVSARDLDTATSNLEQARAATQSAEARLAKARLNLSYTSVEAPVSGVTSRAELSDGSLVGPESLLTRISQVQPIWVRFSIPDDQLQQLERAIASGTIVAPPDADREVEITLAEGRVYSERGRVNFSDSMIDPRTGSIGLRAELPNADGLLVPGQFVRARLLGIIRPDTVVVPQRAVQQGRDGKYVFVVGDDMVAVSRPVTAGAWMGSDWVIESGLQGGERVVVDGVARVKAGAPVRLAAPPGASGPAPAPSRPSAPAAGR